MKNYYYRSERWKPIPKTIYPCTNNGLGNATIYHPNPIYEVSNLGRVRNKNTKQILSVRNYKGYSQVTVRGKYELNWCDDHNWFLKNSRSMSLSVGRLVAAAFIFGDDLKKWYIVRHIDGNSANNCLENLDVKY